MPRQRAPQPARKPAPCPVRVVTSWEEGAEAESEGYKLFRGKLTRGHVTLKLRFREARP